MHFKIAAFKITIAYGALIPRTLISTVHTTSARLPDVNWTLNRNEADLFSTFCNALQPDMQPVNARCNITLEIAEALTKCPVRALRDTFNQLIGCSADYALFRHFSINPVCLKK